MSDLRTHAETIHEQFSDQLDVPVDEIEERLDTLVNEYKVPVDEAKRSVQSHYLNETGMDRDDIASGGNAEAITVDEIDQDDQWVELTAKVVELWEPRHESIAQTGLLADETGRTKFTKWDRADFPDLEEGTVYRFSNAVTDEFEGRFSVTFNQTTVVEELDEDIEVDSGRERVGGPDDPAEVADIDADNKWIDLTVKVVDLWEPRHESIAQTGLIGDASGRTKFTKWGRADLPDLEEDAVYRITNAVTDEFDGQFSVNLDTSTTIEKVDEDIEVGTMEVELEGPIVDIQDGSGLIKRCPEEDCTRVLQNGRCSEHGEVEGEFDLRLKAVIDDGDEVHDVLFNREATEALTGTTLEEAKDAAMDALDTTVVGDEMRTDVIGRYYRVAGPTMGRYLLVNEHEKLGAPTDAAAALIRGRSL